MDHLWIVYEDEEWCKITGKKYLVKVVNKMQAVDLISSG